MANLKREITKYIKDFCKLYSLDYESFFYDYDDDYIPHPTSIFGRKSIESQLPIISEFFGLTHEEILNTSNEGLNKWYKKYSFFYHYPRFMATYAHTWLGAEDEVTKVYLTKVVFGKEAENLKYPYRYDPNDIKTRLIDKLKELDTFLPGTYHEGAKIQNLSLETEHFCSYPQAKEMVSSLLNMIYRAKELFFKAKEHNLEQDEIHEYNFLVSVLKLRDFPTGEMLYYRYVVALRDTYKIETYKDFYSYVRTMNYSHLYPWHSKEFLEEKELLQAYINEYSEYVSQYREDARKIAKLCCNFIWSDAEYIKNPFEDNLWDDTPSIDIQEATTVYLDKTKEDLRNDDEFADKLLRLFGCSNSGGVTIPKRELPYNHRFQDSKRRNLHEKALKGVNND